MSNNLPPPKGWTAERVREHLQNAIYLEMWTVPLYLTAAYSLDVPVNPATNRPEFAPVPMKGGNPDFDKFKQKDYNQFAFNNILSVAIQEMLHVELASNLLNAVRSPENSTPVTFTGSGSNPQPPNSAPQYDAVPPCLKDGVLPSGVTLRLGKFDENQALLFQWVETDQPLPPHYDVEEWHASYTSIGHFYTSLMYGMVACWADLYPAAGRAQDPYQRDDWESAAKKVRGGQMLRMLFSQPPPAAAAQGSAASGAAPLDSTSYKNFSIPVYGSPDEAQIRALAAATAIKVQGEGAGGTQEIPVVFRPTGDASDAIEIALDKVSHWERFHALVDLASEGKFTYVQPVENPAHDHFLNALNQSYSSFLMSLNWAFSNQGNMSIAAMAGLGNRVLQAWQNNVTAAEMFQWVDGSTFIDPTGAKGFHACQGLDAAGTSDCATGFYHTCAGSNMCKGQGGCGALISNSEQPPITWQPGTNECQGKGHCGIPIPAGQCFVDDNNKGQSVWEYARQLINQPTDTPPANDLRTALTGTGGTCGEGK